MANVLRKYIDNSTLISKKKTDLFPDKPTLLLDLYTYITDVVKDFLNPNKTINLDIGDWDMDAAATTTVAHGLTAAQLVKLKTTTAMIHADADATPETQYPDGCLDAGLAQYTVVSIDATNVNLERRTGGIFDVVAFNDTSYNRGSVTLSYEL